MSPTRTIEHMLQMIRRVDLQGLLCALKHPRQVHDVFAEQQFVSVAEDIPPGLPGLPGTTQLRR